MRKAADNAGSYSAKDITPEDKKRGADAKAQAADGHNPPSWVADEDLWSKAKDAAGQTYDEGDVAYWPAVVHIYGNLGGSIKAAKAMPAHADNVDPQHARGADVTDMKARVSDLETMMSDAGVTASDVAAESGLDEATVQGIIDGTVTPTEAQLSAMEDACGTLCKADVEKGDVPGHEFHGNQYGGGGGAKPGSRNGKGSSARSGEAFSQMRGSMAQVFESDDKGTRDDAKSIMQSITAAQERLGEGDNEGFHASAGKARDRAILAASTAKTPRDQRNLRAAARSIGTMIQNTRKSDANADPVALLKAGLGMSDGEFRRMLSQAVYARWGKQGCVDDVFPDTQVAIVKVWDGDPWESSFRVAQVPYDSEGGVVTLGDVAGEVRQTYEPVAKAAPAKSAAVEYVADLDEKSGEYVVAGLNGEAELLRKAVEDSGCRARVDGAGDSKRLIFSRDGVTCRKRQLAIRCEAEGEFDTDTAGFVPYLRDEVMLAKADEKGIVYAVVYEPDVVDKQGEWANADDIEEAAHDYLKRSRRMKRQHEDATDSEVVESYIAQADFLLGNRVVRKGSWVIAEQLGTTAKKLYKEGKLTGVSMGGTCSYAA